MATTAGTNPISSGLKKAPTIIEEPEEAFGSDRKKSNRKKADNLMQLMSHEDFQEIKSQIEADLH